MQHTREPRRVESLRDRVTGRVRARAGRFPDLGPEPLDLAGLDRRDATLAYAIDHAVARRWLSLVAVLETHLTRPWPAARPGVQAALLVGAAQLLLLERLPDHAVINEAVGWVKRGPGGARAGGLVNAVLRRVAASRLERVELAGREPPFGRDELPLESGAGWRLDGPVFADEPIARLGAQTSHPIPLLRRWVERFGAKRAGELAVHDLVHPPILINGPSAGTTLAQHDEAGFRIFDGSRETLGRFLETHPELWVQDPASAAAVAATASLRPRLVVDACAGRGTKTRQLARLHPDARIVASDANPKRRATLSALFAPGRRVEVAKPQQLVELAGAADLVLVDPPCSNTGVLARRVEARYRFVTRGLEALVGLQRQITAEALRALGPGGHLLYSTCSLEREENEEQVAWMTRWHPLELVMEESRWPRGGPGGPPASYADGGYYALLRRSSRPAPSARMSSGPTDRPSEPTTTP